MIAFFVPLIYPCAIGGMEIYYYHLINELSKKNEVILFTTCKRFKNEKCHILPVSAVIFYIKKFHLGHISLFISTLLRLIFHYRNISVIHVPCTSNSGFYGYFFPLIKFLFGIPYIIQFHGGGMRSWKKYDGNRLLFKHASKILAVSDTIKEEYEQRSGKLIEVVLPLVPYSNSKKSKKQLKIDYGYCENDIVFIMVGSVKPLKGNIYVYKEFTSLSIDYIRRNRLNLLFVGRGADSAKLDQMINSDQMHDFVKIIDQVPNERIHEIYGLADYYIIGSDFEGTPKSLLEAMYSGLPIIATDVDGINIIIEHRKNGLLVKKEKGSLRDAIIEIINNNDLALQLAKKAKDTYKEKYSYDIIVNRLRDIYHSI